jgi:hypothetical protein
MGIASAIFVHYTFLFKIKSYCGHDPRQYIELQWSGHEGISRDVNCIMYR